MDKNTKVMLSTELEALYKESYNVDLPSNWVDLLEKYDEEFKIEQ